MVQVLKVENLLLNHNHVSLRKEFQGFWFLQLKKSRKEYNRLRRKSQKSIMDREQPIFTDPDGHVPHPDTFTRHLGKLYKQCGLSEDYHLHTLRHFYATYLLQEGTSKQVAASLLGHADTAFLERTYCHP